MRETARRIVSSAVPVGTGCLLLNVAVGRAQKTSADLDAALLAAAEKQAKAWLDFLLKVQRHGALPTTVVCDADSGAPKPLDRIVNDDSAAALGKPFLWAYRISQVPARWPMSLTWDRSSGTPTLQAC